MQSETPAGPDRSSAVGTVAYRLVRAMLVVLFFGLFLKFGGFLLNVFVGRLFKAGAESNAYFFACQALVFNLVFATALNVLIPAFTPIFIEEKNKRGEKAAWDFANTVLNLLLVGCVCAAALAYFYAGPITDTLVPGFGEEARTLGVRLLRWMLPGSVAIVVCLVLRGILNSYKVFSYPSAGEAAQKFVWAVMLWLTYHYLHLGIYAVVFGFLTGCVVQFIITLAGLRGRLSLYSLSLPSLDRGRLLKESALGAVFFVAGAGVLYAVEHQLPESLSRYRDLIKLTVVLAGALGYALQMWLRCRTRVGVMARFGALLVPLVIGTVFARYRDFVTFYFQSFTSRGVFSDIEYARRVALLPAVLVALALSVAMFPFLCELASRRNLSMLGGLVTKALHMLALGFVPLTVMTVILADPVIRLVFDRGDWPAVHLAYTSRALQFLALGLVVYASEYVIMQGYFSLQRMWVPTLTGIMATFLHFALLALPIYVFRMDHPLQIFVVVALAYPVSRLFKNLVLLVVLRRHVPVLSGRKSLVFVGKLAIVSLAVGLATWFAATLTEPHLPYEPYRQQKVIIDSFESQPDTWFSVNAVSLGIGSPEGVAGTDGCAVKMGYKRHGRVRASLDRTFGGVRTGKARKLEFSLYSVWSMDGISVLVERTDGEERARTIAFRDAEQEAEVGWRNITFEIEEGAPIRSIKWFEEPSPSAVPQNEFFLDDVRLCDADGNTIFEEDFDLNGWQVEGAGTCRIENTRGFEEAPRYALILHASASSVGKDLRGYDLSGATRFRCRLSGRGAPAKTEIHLLSNAETKVHEVSVPKGEWKTVDLSWKDLGYERADALAGVKAIKLKVAAPHKGVCLDDVTFRRPPRFAYELVKLMRCVLPTLAGLAAFVLCVLLLRFEEIAAISAWIKGRGWRREKAEIEDAADA